MQLFILLYIEAGSYINDEEEGWEFVILLVFHRTLLAMQQGNEGTGTRNENASMARQLTISWATLRSITFIVSQKKSGYVSGKCCILAQRR